LNENPLPLRETKGLGYKNLGLNPFLSLKETDMETTPEFDEDLDNFVNQGLIRSYELKSCNFGDHQSLVIELFSGHKISITSRSSYSSYLSIDTW
jgi:hypothetical protein